MTRPLSTRLFELGLPLFSGLNLGLLMEAQADVAAGNFGGLTKLISSLGDMGVTKTIRKLAALWHATEIELRQAEADAKVMLELEARAAEIPFAEAFQAAMDFQLALFQSLGVAPASSATEAAPKLKTKKKAAEVATPSAD